MSAMTMAEVLVDHQRQNSSSCLCGWAKLGHSHPEHQAAALSAAGFGPVKDSRAQALEDAAAIAGRPENRWWAEGQNRAKWLRNLAEAERNGQ